MSIILPKEECIAKICHEANRAYCEVTGDGSQKPWHEADRWQKDSAILGVQYRLANPDAPISEQHEAWVRDKVAQGWKNGPAKDPDKKEHPCICPYDELPEFQKVKDRLFVAIVKALSVKEG